MAAMVLYWNLERPPASKDAETGYGD
jgi:hypothetical protein